MEVIYEGPSQIFADRKIMFRILLNLARNAGIVGATELKIDIWRAGHLGVIDILDNSPGISEDARRTLFQAFKTTKAGDTGLGLAITSDLAVALGGNLKLTRSNQDGSEFRLQLPKQIFLNYPRSPMIGVDGCGSMSQGKKIHVSCDTSVTKVSTRGRPAGFA